MDEIHWTAWIPPCCWDAVSRFSLAFCVLCFAVSGFSQKPPVTKVLFQNVRVFDGKSQTLSPPTNVLVMGNKIERISTTPIPAARRADTVVIDAGRGTHRPGLIDMQWHARRGRAPPAAVMADDVGYTNLVAGVEATDTLMRGFTTVRDVGGPTFSLKRSIDEGLIAGPRIYPSGAM